MKFALNILTRGFLLLVSSSTAAAELSRLTAAADLVIHPAQVVELLELANQKMAEPSFWNWPELNLTRPYRTKWQHMVVGGGLSVRLLTEAVANQEVGFELEWVNPSLRVSSLHLDDVISRNVGGHNVELHIVGKCSGLQVEIPDSVWRAKGRMRWNWAQSGFELNWQDFQFSPTGSSQPEFRMGNCQGPSGLREAVQAAVESSLRDASWLQVVLRDSMLGYAQSSLASLQSELMRSRKVALTKGIDLEWQPEVLQVSGRGLLRVQGQFVVQKLTKVAHSRTLLSTYSQGQLEQSRESGFLLPKDVVPELLRFLYELGELRYRTSSDKINSFKSLMSQRLLQLFVWPDLMSFKKDTAFVFDIFSAQMPKVDHGVALKSGGVAYPVETLVGLNQWAFWGREYVPYVDFSGRLNGHLEAKVQGQKLTLKVLPDSLDLRQSFRREMSARRVVNPWMAMSLIESSVGSYLTENTLSVDLPVWQLSSGLKLVVRDLEQRKQSFRIPLGFQK